MILKCNLSEGELNSVQHALNSVLAAPTELARMGW